LTAERLRPGAIFIKPDFVRYKAVSQAVHEIFQQHTEMIGPLSLDEAYLDVTENKMGIPTATRVAKTIRKQIQDELNLMAPAGVAPNKFLAKIASDRNKLNGLFVTQPHEIEAFPLSLPVGRIPGVGRVTEERMKQAGIKTIGDIHTMELTTLENYFGRYGLGLYELARAIDHSPVVANRVSKQTSAEDTLPEDIPLAETETGLTTAPEGSSRLLPDISSFAHGIRLWRQSRASELI
jgi:DNA polymerase-4